jgi:hypothetical protein
VRPLALRRCAKRLRHRRGALIAIWLVAASIAAHHTAMNLTADAHHGMDMGPVAELCLGVFTAVGAAAVSIALGFVSLGRWRPPATLGPEGLGATLRAFRPPARAGPDLLLELCISRR